MDLLPSLGLIMLVAVTAINILLAFVVYRSGPGEVVNKLFGLLSIDLSLCLIAVQLSLQPGMSAEYSLTWIRICIFFAVPIVFLFYLLVKSIPEGRLGIKKTKLFVYIFGSLIVMLLTLTPFVFSGAIPTTGIARPVPGPGIVIFVGYVLGGTGSLALLLLRKVRSLKGQERKQLLYIAIGALSMLILVFATIVIPVAVFQNGSFVLFFPVYTLFFTGAASYAILKHRLFDVKVLATEATTFVLWIILFSKLFVSGSVTLFVVDTIILFLVVVFGLILIRSVRREVEQRKELEVLNQKLEELDKQKTEFLNVASHELRAPMTSVKGYISMTRDGDGGEIPIAAQELLTEASEEAERMIRLVNNMLNVARIEEGRMVFEEGDVHLSEVVERIFEEYKFAAENKALDYALEPMKDVSDFVRVDVDRIHEVVSNLVSNAIKYTDKGKVTVRLVNPKAEIVRCEVEDTGPGMTKDELGKLFQKFYRAESYVGKKMGTGLGLYISKRLVEKFGGQIGVKSEKGKGSLFWFELPVKVAA